MLLDLLGEGLTNKQIAARMFLAEKTVKNYVSRLLAELGMEPALRLPFSCRSSTTHTARQKRKYSSRSGLTTATRCENQDRDRGRAGRRSRRPSNA